MTTQALPAVARLAFGPFVIEPDTGRLFRGQEPVPLAPKPFETLLYLVRRPGRVVPKSELIDALWHDTFVTEDVLVQSVVEARRALGDQARTPRYIATLPRRGYQFLESVRVLPVDGLPEAPGPETPPPTALAGTPLAVREPVVTPAPGGGRRRWVLPAGASLALGLAAALVWRSQTPPAVLPEPEHGWLVVLPFRVEEAQPQSGWLSQGLAEMIQSQLGQTPGLRIVARHQLAAALAESGVSPGGASEAKAAALARRLRAETLISGSFVRVEDRFVMSAQVTEVAAGRTRGTASVRGRYPTEILDAVDSLCLKLVEQLDARGDTSVPGGWRPTGLATRSLDASRQYVEALGWFARGGRRGAEEAERRLDDALRLDASFAQAYLKKAEIQQWRRSWGYGDPDPSAAVRAALSHARDLPDRERLLVRSYEASIVRRDSGEALALWEALLRSHPGYAAEAGIPTLMAEALQREGRWDDLITRGEAQVGSASLPDGERARLSSMLARAFRRKGEFARALEHARRAVQLWPGAHGPEYLWQRSELGRISLEAGRRDDALAEFRAVAAAPEAEARNLTDAGWGLYMAGAGDEARTLTQRALALDAGYGNAHHLRGWLQLAAGEPAAAAASFESAFEKTPQAFGRPHQGLVKGDLAALYYAGVAHARAGDEAQARAAFERLIGICRRVVAESGAAGHRAPAWQAANFQARAAARLGRRGPEPVRLAGDDTTYYVQTARLHAVQGRARQALDELARGLALGHGEHRHVRDDPDFESLRGLPEFERLVTPSWQEAGSQTPRAALEHLQRRAGLLRAGVRLATADRCRRPADRVATTGWARTTPCRPPPNAAWHKPRPDTSVRPLASSQGMQQHGARAARPAALHFAVRLGRRQAVRSLQGLVVGLASPERAGCASATRLARSASLTQRRWRDASSTVHPQA